MKIKAILIIFNLLFTLNIFGISPKLQLGFVENLGQIQNQFGEINKEVLYNYTSSNLSVQLRKNGFSYELLKQIDASNFKAHRIDIDFVGSDRNCLKTPNEKGSGEWIVRNSYNTVNSIKVNHYKNVYYTNVYPNIDIEFLIVSTAGKERFKYNFILHPGANENDIKLLISGAKKQKVLANGSILIETSLGNLEEQVPLSYEQLPNGKMGSKIKAGFKSLGSNLFGLSIANYNKAHTAIIDPMVWSTYFGGTGSDIANRITLDKSNNIYIAGLTNTTFNLATNGAHQTVFGGLAQDGFIAKFNSLGVLQWATYFGGSGYDEITTLAIDTAQNLVFGGFTVSTSGIATTGAYQTSKAGNSSTNDGFLGKFSPNGNLLWASYFGGNLSDNVTRIAISSNNDIMVTVNTNSTDFNFTTPDVHQRSLAGNYDIVIAKFTPNGNLVWGTYYGGFNYDYPSGISLDKNGNSYITGYSLSDTGISETNAYQSTLNGSRDAIIAKFNSLGKRIFATYYGGNNVDYANDICLDGEGNLVIVGYTTSSNNIALPGAQDSLLAGSSGDGFILKMDTLNGTPIWARYFGGNGIDIINSVKCANNLDIYIGGYTSSGEDVNTTNGFQTTFGGSVDGHFAHFDKNGNLLFGSYFGGLANDQIGEIAIDAIGNFYASGRTASTNNIASVGAHQTSYSAQNDAFVFKFNFGSPPQILSNNVISGGQNTCGAAAPNPITGSLPVGGTGSYTYMWYQSTTSASGPWILASGSNNLQNYSPAPLSTETWFLRSVKSGADSLLSNVLSIGIGSAIKAGFTINKLIQCVNDNMFIVEDTTQVGNTGFTRLWDFDNGQTSTERIDSVSYVMDIINAKRIRLIISDNGDCADTATQTVYFIANPKPINIAGKDTVIWGNVDTFNVSNTLGSNYFWSFTNAIGYSIQSAIQLKWVQTGDMQLSVVERSSGNCFGDTVYKDVHIKLPALGSNQIEGLAQPILYPNPASQFVQISFGSNQTYAYQIWNMLGEQIKTGSINNGENININGLPKALYVIKLQNENGQTWQTKLQVID